MNGALFAGFDTSDQTLLLVVEVAAPVNVNHFITNTIVTIKSIMVNIITAITSITSVIIISHVNLPITKRSEKIQLLPTCPREKDKAATSLNHLS